MRNRLTARPRVAAFTLIEILVVGLLIAILSAIGLISVQSFMRRSQIRVTIGEAAQIATGLSFARDDIGFYPKISFLLFGKNQIGTNLGEVNASTNPLSPDFAQYGNDISSITARIVQGWNGPYIGMSSGRRGTGGPTIVTMQLPESNQSVEYPGDVWYQPYCVYAMSIDEDGLISFNTNENRRRPGVTEPEYWQVHGDFFNAVVSYGPNQVPGGQTPPATANLPTRAAQEAARLYTVVDFRNHIYRALRTSTDRADDEFRRTDRINAYFAIVDEASDDLVRQF